MSLNVFKPEAELSVNVVETAVPEPANRVWKEVLSASYSSSTSGNWSWDASDQSVPSTPSPPLSNDTNKNFLLSSQGDDVSEDVTESTHFMFEDPIPRKRKVCILKRYRSRCKYLIYTLNHKYFNHSAPVKKFLPKNLTA